MSSNTNPYEFLYLVKESAYGTIMSTPAAGTDSLYVRLAGANRFGMRAKPKMRPIDFGGGFKSRGYTVSDQVETTGDLSLELCYSQAKILLDWGTTRISGGTIPWTTSEPNGDLPSCSIYHGVMRSDGTIRRRWYSGVKVLSYNLAVGAQSGVMMLKLGLRSKGPQADPNGTTFPLPADTVFPIDPVMHFHGAGTNDVGGAALAFLEGLTVDVTNTLDAKYFQSANGQLTFDRLRGRETKLGLDLLYSASPEWRTLYEALTAESASMSWTNGTNTIALNFQGNNLIDGVDDDLTPGQVYMQKVSLVGQWDTATSSLVGFTFT